MRMHIYRCVELACIGMPLRVSLSTIQSYLHVHKLAQIYEYYTILEKVQHVVFTERYQMSTVLLYTLLDGRCDLLILCHRSDSPRNRSLKPTCCLSL